MPMFRALLGREALEQPIVEVDELPEHVLPGPGIAGIVLVRQPALGEVDRDPDRAGGEALADVLLALVDHIGQELLPRIAVEFPLQRIQEAHHRRRDHRLLDGMSGRLDVLLDELGRVGLVAERSPGQPRQLAMMAVIEDREELPVPGQVLGQAGAGERVRDRVRREARLPLLAVGDDRLARGL